MIAAHKSFEDVILAVKDETGISNMRPLRDRISRHMFRAERDIGVGGSIILKRAVFSKKKNNMSRFLKFPEDLIEFESIGDCCGPTPKRNYNVTSEGIRFCCKVLPEKITMYYWGVYCDGTGNPITTEIRFDAVVAFIIWKMYAPFVFINKGSLRTLDYYKDWYEDKAMDARGQQAMPTWEEWNEIAIMQDTERSLLVHSFNRMDYCTECINDSICMETDTILDKIYFWQLENPGQDIEWIAGEIDDEFLIQQTSDSVEVFALGRMINYDQVGRICFGVKTETDLDFSFYDILGNNITSQFDKKHIPEKEMVIWVSQNHHVHSTIFFKLNLLP